jgi:nitroimidazol reductase NimA-like FMN-containing flavoprotein (pyridoxamine 5'-phosphate oxidase superfamily)
MRVPDVDLGAARRMFGGLPTVAVATIGPDGPHVVPLWFVWPDDAVYVSTDRGSRTWRNVSADPRVSLSVDLGRAWVEIAGIEIRGRAELLPAEHPEMRQPISAWHDKYRPLLAGDGFARLAEAIPALSFLRVVPERVSGWDHARP